MKNMLLLGMVLLSSACSKMSTVGSLTNDVIGNGSTGLRIEDLPAGDSKLPVLERVIMAYEQGSVLTMEDAQGTWVGAFIYRDHDGMDITLNYLFRFDQIDTSFERPIVMGRVTSQAIDLKVTSSKVIPGRLLQRLEVNKNNLNISRANLSSEAFSITNSFRTLKWLGNTSYEYGPFKAHTSSIRRFKNGIVGTIGKGDGEVCEPFDNVDLWDPSSEVHTGHLVKSGPGIDGVCGVWLMFRKLE